MEPSPEEANLLGAVGDYQAEGIDHEEVEKVLVRISKDGTLNARQAIEAAKGAFSEGVSPVFPPDIPVATRGPATKENDAANEERTGQSRWAQLVFGEGTKPDERSTSYQGMPRETISTYTDGGVKNPANKWLATAGFGIWTPEAGTEEEASGDAVELTFRAKEGGGLKQWARLTGQRCSSTRVETAAAIIALSRPKFIHIGTDSAAMLHKALKLQKAAATWMDSVANNWLPREIHLGNPGACKRMETSGRTCGKPPL